MLDFAHMFSSFFMKMGTNQLDCEQINDRIQMNNLNFECKYINYEDYDSNYAMKHFIVIEGLCLDKNINRMMDLLNLMTKSVDFSDLEILSKVLKYESSEMVNKISEFTGESLKEISASYISPALD